MDPIRLALLFKPKSGPLLSTRFTLSQPVRSVPASLLDLRRVRDKGAGGGDHGEAQVGSFWVLLRVVVNLSSSSAKVRRSPVSGGVDEASQCSGEHDEASEGFDEALTAQGGGGDGDE